MNFKEYLLTPYGIITAICVILYALPFVFGINPMLLNSLGWKDNSAIADGQWYRLISSIFLHGSFWHIMLNMYSLYNIGPTVKNIFDYTGQNGNMAFITIFLVSGICGSLASYYFTANPSLGASGAIFGLMGAMTAFAVLKNETEMLQSIMFIFAINVFYGFTTAGIDNSAHFGGFIGGIIAGLILILV